MQPPRRLPPPWTVVENTESFEVRDANGQNLAYIYFEDQPDRRHQLTGELLLTSLAFRNY
jgi:hypothetical protein